MDRAGRAMEKSLGFRGAGKTSLAGRERYSLAKKSDRSLYSRQTGVKRTAPGAGSRQANLDSARNTRFDRSATDPGGGECIRQGSFQGRLREGGRSLIGIAALWRTAGALLVGRRALRGYAGHPYR